jgi:hypothetical protein|tara:strand:+ start:679 stop:984 length:306 start_codon:yes stop_codon:yes gene_type:complete
MKRPVRDPITGGYTIKGGFYKELFGSREQVMNGTAYKTSGGLKKSELLMNGRGRIVSKKKYETAKKEKRLEKYGFFAKKGKFGYVKKKTRKNKKNLSTKKK